MSYDCGQSIDLKDPYGSRSLRFIMQCHGQWLVINHMWGGLPHNGYLLHDWRAVLRELVAKTVPAKLANERGLIAEGLAGGTYESILLGWPLSAASEDADAVRHELEDLAVQYE